jgi:rare lipoprotein A
MNRLLTTLLAVLGVARSESDVLRPLTGCASWYGKDYAGHIMANGHPFDPEALTCATYAYPLGTVLRVVCNRRSVRVLVTDRGPAPRLHRFLQLHPDVTLTVLLDDETYKK